MEECIGPSRLCDTGNLVAQECSRCRVKKPASMFFRDKWRSTGLCSYCKACSASAVARKQERSAIAEEPNVGHKASPNTPFSHSQRT